VEAEAVEAVEAVPLALEAVEAVPLALEAVAPLLWGF
jgi:hypothetical protein